jgi:hypothetical protein
MRLTFRHTLSDILELNRSACEQWIKAWLVMFVGIAILFVGVWLGLRDKDLELFLSVVGVAAVFVLLGALGPHLAGLGAWLFKAQRVPYELQIGPEGVAFQEVGEQTLVKWESFSRWYTTKNLLVLVNAVDAVAIPRRSCGDAAWTELLVIVGKGLGDPARW